MVEDILREQSSREPGSSMISLLEMCQDLPLCRRAAGETVLLEGQRSGVLYFLTSGEVEIVKQGIQIDRVSEPGSIFGEMSLLLDQPHTATVRALTNTTFRQAEKPAEFAQAHPELYRHVSFLLAQRLQSVTDHLVETRLHMAGGSDHALSRRIMEALQRCLGAPAT